jgi:hypothetical protein
VAGSEFRKEEFKSRTRGKTRFNKEDIRPSQSLRVQDTDFDYGDTELMSGQQEPTVPTVITVTHQVLTRTVFTIYEGGETKSLYADTFESSLEVLAVSDLKSTEINSHRVVYAHAQTIQPAFGVTEYQYEAIQPTRTSSTQDKSFKLGGRFTTVPHTVYSTIYNVEKITARVTETQSLAPTANAPDVSQIGALLQNVILKLLGGGLLGAGLDAGSPTIHGPPRTQLITHTRSFLTTATSMETVIIPVNFRGSKIFQTVTDLKTSIVTTTDHSVQTLLNYDKPTADPFLPLAPTLHRAARVVSTQPAFLNNISPPSFSTTYLTTTQTEVNTLTTDQTSEIVVTLGGKEVTTDIVQATTMVVTDLIVSTQSLLVQQPQQQNPEAAVRRLQLIRALLKLNL